MSRLRGTACLTLTHPLGNPVSIDDSGALRGSDTGCFPVGSGGQFKWGSAAPTACPVTHGGSAP